MDECYSTGLLAMIGAIIICAVIAVIMVSLLLKFVDFVKRKQEARRQAEKDMWRHTDTPIDD